MDDNRWLVGELIASIQSKRTTIKQIADELGKSDKTIGKKIQSLGYQWDNSFKWYDYVGDKPEPKEIDFRTLFDNKVNASEEIAKKDISTDEKKALDKHKPISQVSSELHKSIREKSLNNKRKAEILKDNINASNIKARSKENDSEYDIIDILLEAKPKTERVYRGFYFDEDIIEIINSVGNRNKSELINQCLRKIFKEKGLL